MVNKQVLPRPQLLRWLAWFTFINIVVLFIISLRFLIYMLPFESGIEWAYALTTLFAQMGILAILLTIPLSVGISLFPNKKLWIPLIILLFAIAQLTLIINTFVYAQFRFHISGFVIDLILDAGGEVFAFSWFTWLVISVIALMTIGIEILLASIILRHFKQANSIIKARYALISTLVIIFASQSLHVWADASYDNRITRLTPHIPYYHPITAKGLMRKYGLVDTKIQREQRRINLSTHSRILNYPLQAMQCKPEQQQALNLVVIMIDSWRYDVLGKVETPMLYQFMQDHPVQQFKQHHSGGNSTRTGVFSLFYGLPATYWQHMYGNQTAPVLINELQKNNTEITAFSSATLARPSFDRTVFSKISNLRLASDGDEPWKRDEHTLKDWFTFLDNKKDNAHFFSFIFLDAVHGNNMPPDYPKVFQPFLERVDHISLNNNYDPKPFFNRYKTSVHYVDSLLGKVFADLKQRKLYDNTIVIVTSDHGQEFNENDLNYWGHGSNFTSYQTQVPFLMYWPGQEAKQYEHKTSHLDVVPTLMTDLLNCDNPISDYASGEHLKKPGNRDWLIIASYVNYAIVQDDRITVSYPTGHYDILGLDNRIIKDAKLRPAIVKQALNEMVKFSRP